MSSIADDDVHARTHLLAQQLGIGPNALDGLALRRVVLEIGADAARNSVGKLAFLTLCNLVTRLGPYVPNLYVLAPEGEASLDSSTYPACGGSLASQAQWALRAAIPTSNLVRNLAGPGDTFELSISIGTPVASAKDRVRVSWDGWLAIVGSEDDIVPAAAETNPFGAIVAAAIAAARLHALQLVTVGANIQVPQVTCRLNALALNGTSGGPSLPAAGVEMPRALLVGGGALASAFCYAMTHVQSLRGEVDATDRDVLKTSNANRQITAPFTSAESEQVPKVDDLAAAWSSVRPVQLMYEEFKVHHRRSAGDYELAITAVDNAEVRREVAKDLPKVIIDGATGGLMIALMRGSDPTVSCVACAYAEIATDEDEVWSQRLGTTRERVRRLRLGSIAFTPDVVAEIKAKGSLTVDDEVEVGLKREGWAYLIRARCGNAKPDRDLPAASVSYVSAICGFLMAAQAIGESIRAPGLIDSPRWVWSDVLREPPQDAEREPPTTSPSCSARHELRSRIYRDKWRAS